MSRINKGQIYLKVLVFPMLLCSEVSPRWFDANVQACSFGITLQPVPLGFGRFLSPTAGLLRKHERPTRTGVGGGVGALCTSTSGKVMVNQGIITIRTTFIDSFLQQFEIARKRHGELL